MARPRFPSPVNSARGAIAAAVFLIAGSLCAQTVPTNGLIGHWQGENNASDSSVTANNGSFAGSYATGAVGSAFSITGSNYVSIPDHAAYDFSAGDFSVGFWFNLNGQSTSNTICFLGQDNGPANQAKWFVTYNYNTAGKFDFDFYGPAISDNNFLSNPAALTSSGWYQLTVTRSGTGTGAVVTFYLGGTQIGSVNQTTSDAFPNPTNPFTLGFAEGALGFNGGLLDEIVLYNRALSAGEAAGLAGVPEPATGALLAGLGVLALAAWRRRATAST